MRVCMGCESELLADCDNTHEWCKKCAKKNYQDPIIEIPLEAFADHILPRLELQDIINLSEVSKEHAIYFNDNDIWRQFHLKKRIEMFIPRQLKEMCVKQLKNNPTHSWSSSEIRTNPVSMLIINQTKNISFDIYFNYGYDKPDGGMTKLHKTGLKPGEEWFCQTTYTTHKWVVVASEEWLLKNKVSNVGFAFHVNVLDLKDAVVPPGHGGGWIHDGRAGGRPQAVSGQTKPTHVKILTEPNGNRHPIKPLNKKYASYKHEFMCLSLDKEKVTKKKKDNLKETMDDKKRLKALRRKTQLLEQKIKNGMRNEKGYNKTLKILKGA